MVTIGVSQEKSQHNVNNNKTSGKMKKFIVLGIIGLLLLTLGFLAGKFYPDSDEERGLKISGFLLSSTGQCSEHNGGALGIYDVVIDDEDMDKRVYKQRGEENYIYKQNRIWYVGHQIGFKTKLKTNDLFDVESVWSCSYNETYWMNGDTTIKFSPLTSDSCILSSRLRLSSSGPAGTAVSDYLGVYQRLPNMFSGGRSVWKNDHGKALMILPEDTQFAVYDDISASDFWILSRSGPTCPTDEKAENSLRFDSGWEYWNGSMFISDKTMKVDLE